MTTEIHPRRLYLLQLKIASVPTPAGPLEMALGCYLIRMSDGRHVLIDSGLSADYPTPGLIPLTEESTVIAHLDRLGLRPEDIDLLICSHFDIDHVGYHGAFSGAACIVQRAQYEAAKGGHPRFAEGRAHWDHPALRYRLVDGDTELLPGLSLIETGAHVPGHQSILVRLPQTGPVLLAIDAVPMQSMFSLERAPWPGDEAPDRLRADMQKLLDLVAREGAALVVFGHDGAQWRTLKTAPDWYE